VRAKAQAIETARKASARLASMGTEERARVSRSFFKTGEGEYGHGDRFVGVTVPDTRKVAAECRDLPLPEVLVLLRSEVHEERLLALLILVGRYERGGEAERREVFDLYLAHTRHVNNWDLVDASAPGVVGAHLLDRSRRVLLRLARSADLWERRIAVVATFAFIRRGEFDDTLAVVEHLLGDPHDLIHKACGWMLREVGKRDPSVLEAFLAEHYSAMPRTMLRYAIERFPEARRKAYLRGAI
jgi:3-methyladenine DNA glycosylase AlkD